MGGILRRQRSMEPCFDRGPAAPLLNVFDCNEIHRRNWE